MGIQINGLNDNITSTDGSLTVTGYQLSGATNINTTGIITASTANFTGNVSIAGTLTYEDVTSVDSVGIITAQSDVSIADKIIHTGDTNTALRFPAADTITAETGGSERLRITSNGNIGIGIDDPGALLSIPAGESNTPRLAIESAVDDNDFTITQYEDGNGTYTMLGQNVKLDSGGNNAILDSGHKTAGILLDARNHGAITFLTGGTNAALEPLKIDSSGRVLLGTTTEGESNADDFTIATSAHTGMTIRSGTANRGNIYFSDGTSGDAEYRGYITYDHDGDKLKLGTANADRLFINSDGKVRVGSGSAAYNFEVQTTGFVETLIGSTNAGGAGIILDGDSNGDGSGGDYAQIFHNTDGTLNFRARNGSGGTDTIFYSNTSERLRITSAGKVFIGSPSDHGPSAYNLANTGLSITAAGENVLRVLDSTSYAADVGGAILMGGNYRTSGDTQPFVELKSFKENATDANYAYGFRIGTSANGQGITERLRITSDGSVGVGKNNPDVTLHIGGAAVTAPEVKLHRTASYDNAWRFFQSHYDANDYGTLFIRPTLATTPNVEITNSSGAMAMRVDSDTGVISVKTGGGINFGSNPNNAGMTSEVLDDYEEGTWTPGLTIGGVVPTYSIQTGSYVKIGRLVVCYGMITLTNRGSGTGGTVITGLPFTVVDILSSTSLEGGGLFTYQSAVTGIHGPMTILPAQSSTTASVYAATSSGGQMGGVQQSNLSNTFDSRFTFSYQTAS